MQGDFLGLGDVDRAELQVNGSAQLGNLCREAEDIGGRAGLRGEARPFLGKSEGRHVPAPDAWSEGESQAAGRERSHHLFPWHERPSNSVQTLPSHRKAQTHRPRHLPSRPLGPTLFWEPGTPLAFHFRCPCSPAWGFPICRTRHQSSFLPGATPTPLGALPMLFSPYLSVSAPPIGPGTSGKVCAFSSPMCYARAWSSCSISGRVPLEPANTTQGPRTPAWAVRSFVHSFTHSFIQWNLSGWGLWLPHRG